jgi:DNA-binding HxlR family transcriptional regulator
MIERPAPAAPTPPVASPGAGAKVLALLANPLNLAVLHAHADGPQRAAELREKVGQPAQTTLRAAIHNLFEYDLLTRQRVSSLPYGVATKLTPAGEEMLRVADVLAAWLSTAPHGPIELGSAAAKYTVKALSAGWSTNVVRALASQPLTLTELDKQITDLSYPSLERRLTQMRLTHQLEPASTSGRSTPYQPTDWLRRSAATLYAGARWEQRHLGEDAAPITGSEIEAAFLLALPLAVLPPEADGECQLAAPLDPLKHPGQSEGLAGARVEVRGGRVVSAVASVEPSPRTWILCTGEAWLDAIIEGQVEELRIGGANPQLAIDLVLGTHLALFGDLSGIRA